MLKKRGLALHNCKSDVWVAKKGAFPGLGGRILELQVQWETLTQESNVENKRGHPMWPLTSTCADQGTHTHTHTSMFLNASICVYVLCEYMVACTQRPKDCRVENSELELQAFVDSEPCYMGTRMWTPVLTTERQTFLPSCSPFGQNIRLLFFLSLGYWSFLRILKISSFSKHVHKYFLILIRLFFTFCIFFLILGPGI